VQPRLLGTNMVAAGGTGSVSRKALVVVDQLPFAALPSDVLRWPFLAKAGRVALGYVPRTTPVGHATISTGLMPADHRIQGREWYMAAGGQLLRMMVDDLPQGALDPRVARPLARHALARRIRSSNPDAGIVITAAKAFIPVPDQRQTSARQRRQAPPHRAG